MTWAVALLAAAIGLEWLVNDANACGRRRRCCCCCDVVSTCCGGHVACDPCETPHTARYGGDEYGEYQYDWESYEYSGEPMTEPYPYYEERTPEMERPQYETGRRPELPSAPEPGITPSTKEEGTEGMRGPEGVEEESQEQPTAPARESQMEVEP
jgi:hypothetical protein